MSQERPISELTVVKKPNGIQFMLFNPQRFGEGGLKQIITYNPDTIFTLRAGEDAFVELPTRKRSDELFSLPERADILREFQFAIIYRNPLPAKKEDK